MSSGYPRMPYAMNAGQWALAKATSVAVFLRNLERRVNDVEVMDGTMTQEEVDRWLDQAKHLEKMG